jgi:cell division protein ZapA (FtsZ GTPase activity inhibitor)
VPLETVRVELLGASFSIQTDESKEYLDAVLEQLRAKVAEVKESSRVDDPLKLAILVGIYLVDELKRARADRGPREELDAERGDELGAIAERLIARIDDSLREASASRTEHVE